MKVTIDESLKGKELFDFLIANKSLLIAEKKYSIKHSDSFHANVTVQDDGNVTKGAPVVKDDVATITIPCVINTTNIMDSHKDVHIPGIWKKSLADTKEFYLLQEHSMTFKGIITDKVNAYTKTLTWKQLGLDAPGETQALIFDATIPKSRNEFMFDQYKNGLVKNHSVGMKYVNIEMAINDEDYKEEFATWNKYIDQIVNKSEAEAEGYFFAVKEAKVIEGSAVPIGSNRITPVLEHKTNTETEPQQSTLEQPLDKSFNIDQLIKNLQIN